MRRVSDIAGLVCLLGALAGCGGEGKPVGTASEASAAKPKFRPIEASAAVFWDRQTNETAKLLGDFITEFNQGRTGPLIKRDFVGGYTDIYRKVSLGIQTGVLPSMAVAYESMTAEYARAGAVMPLDDLINDPQKGFTPEDLADFFPVVLETNRLEGKMYSFPFCKSVLTMYFNKKVLGDAGLTQPPKTWDEFLEQCRQVKAKTGKTAWAISVDCSTISGMIFSMGGEVVSGATTLFDSPPSVRVFELIETLAKEELVRQIPPRSYDDETAFAQDQTAFVFRSSSAKSSIDLLMADRRDQWGIALIPQADPANPRTVLYGPNIVIFATTPEQQRAAWDFAKFFTSRAISVRWALGTGYLPIRKSSADDPAIQEMWRQWEYNRAAFDCLPFAKPEPNLPGWQEVRSLVENAETAVLTGIKTGKQAAADLKQAADAALKKK